MKTFALLAVLTLTSTFFSFTCEAANRAHCEGTGVNVGHKLDVVYSNEHVKVTGTIKSGSGFRKNLNCRGTYQYNVGPQRALEQYFLSDGEDADCTPHYVRIATAIAVEGEGELILVRIEPRGMREGALAHERIYQCEAR